jgi:hypothetical protein
MKPSSPTTYNSTEPSFGIGFLDKRSPNIKDRIQPSHLGRYCLMKEDSNK